jgi:hypothetical protein
MPDDPITLFTDQPGVTCEAITEFRPIRHVEGEHADKILPLLETPYEKTLFLDTDTLMCEGCGDLFEMLDRFELLVAHDPWRAEYHFEKLPECFPTLNTGVIAFRRSPAVLDLIREWHAGYARHFGKLTPADQPAFRHALYHSGVRFAILPGEYNLRTYYPCFVGGHARVKIIHDRNRFARRIARELNRSPRPRIFGHVGLRTLMVYYFTKSVNVALRLCRRFLSGSRPESPSIAQHPGAVPRPAGRPGGNGTE